MKVWARAPEVLDAQRDDGWVLFHSETGAFCDLDAVGAEVWALMAEPIALPAMVEQLVPRFAVDAATCSRDVSAFLESLAARGFAIEQR